MKYLLIFLIALGIFVISITIGADNNQIVTFNYLLAKGEYPLYRLLASLFAVGFILGWVICGLFYLRVRLKLSLIERKVRRLEQKLATLGAEMTAIPMVPKE